MGSEYARQREHMERSVASLRKKLAKDTEIHRKDNIRVMQVKSHRAPSLELEYQTGDYCLLYHHTNSFSLSFSFTAIISLTHTGKCFVAERDKQPPDGAKEIAHHCTRPGGHSKDRTQTGF